MDFWDVHGFWFVLAMMFFPRLTMLFGTAVLSGFWPWMGWVFAPRLSVAIFATSKYWDTNPVLVAITWFWALTAGSSAEKASDRRTRRRQL